MKSKALRFLPLTFLAGTHGFALFAPYVAVVLAALHLRTVSRGRALARARLRDAAPAAGAVPASREPSAPDLGPDLDPVLA